MVLICYIFSALCFFGNPGLYEDYKAEVDKVLLSYFDQCTLNDLDYEYGELKEIMLNNNELGGYLLIAEVASCNIGGCNTVTATKKKSSEYFDLLVLCDKSGRILELKVLDYFSDYGYEITGKRYLKKFKSKSLTDFMNSTDEIDIISGATMSCFALEASLSLLALHLPGISN